LSVNPARILKLSGKGTLRKGADADVTVIDPDAEWEYREADVRSKSRNSPFFGWKLRGRAVATIREGCVTHSLLAGVSPDV
jgi:dihydroorotase